MNAISRYLVNTFRDAKELGSIITVESKDYDGYMAYLDGCDGQGQLTMEDADWLQNTRPMLKALARQAKVLAAKYPIVCTNPPYLNKMEGRLKIFVTENYKDYSGDLFSVFTYRNLMFCKQDGYCGYMTPFVWMFIKTYEKLREFIIQSKSITTLVQMEYSAFEEATVPICAFVLKNGRTNDKGLYFKLSEFKGGMEVQKQKVLEALADKNCGYFYETDQSNFSKIPGSPVAYWVGQKTVDSFREKSFQDCFFAGHGLLTGHDDDMIYYWYEVPYPKIGFGFSCVQEMQASQMKYVPMAKGGDFRKWYGNLYLVAKYDLETVTYMRKYPKFTQQNENRYFQEGVTWTEITSGNLGARYLPAGVIFNHKGPSAFAASHKETIKLTGFMTSVVCNHFTNLINPTITCSAGVMNKVPISNQSEWNEAIAERNINISKSDWDSYENSWDFKRNPLV